jgi:hypothetical protein
VIATSLARSSGVDGPRAGVFCAAPLILIASIANQLATILLFRTIPSLICNSPGTNTKSSTVKAGGLQEIKQFNAGLYTPRLGERQGQLDSMSLAKNRATRFKEKERRGYRGQVTGDKEIGCNL